MDTSVDVIARWVGYVVDHQESPVAFTMGMFAIIGGFVSTVLLSTFEFYAQRGGPCNPFHRECQVKDWAYGRLLLGSYQECLRQCSGYEYFPSPIVRLAIVEANVRWGASRRSRWWVFRGLRVLVGANVVVATATSNPYLRLYPVPIGRSFIARRDWLSAFSGR